MLLQLPSTAQRELLGTMRTFLRISAYSASLIESSSLHLSLCWTHVRGTFSLCKFVLVVFLDELKWRYFVLECDGGGSIVLVCQYLYDCFLLPQLSLDRGVITGAPCSSYFCRGILKTNYLRSQFHRIKNLPSRLRLPPVQTNLECP